MKTNHTSETVKPTESENLKITTREDMEFLILLFRMGKINWKTLKHIFSFEYRVLNNKNQLIYCPTHKSNRYYKHLTLFPAWRMEWSGKGSINRNREAFLNFLQEVGPAPSYKHQLDRQNNNLGYLPFNVRWVTVKENQRNRRNSLSINGKPVIQLAEEMGIKYHTLLARIKRGSFKEAA